mgnify:CR=1 FL=1
MGWKTDIKIITEDGYMSLVPYVIEQTSVVSALMIFIPDFLRKELFFWEKRLMTLPQALS